MTDVTMKDASTSKASTPSGKPRFEVKKVAPLPSLKALELLLTPSVVERSGPLVLGHRRRELRHLSKPYHGPMCASFPYPFPADS
jgi:hypothetical protein